MTPRHVVLAVSRSRSSWINEVGRWAASGAMAIDLTRCISLDEVRARLTSMQTVSAIILDERCVGIDRDLLADARDIGCATIVVTSPNTQRDWEALGATGVIVEPIDRDALMSALRALAPAVERTETITELRRPESPSRAGAGRVVAVTGGGGTGTSTVAISVAQALATAADESSVALVDASLHSSLALLLRSPDIVPGLQEFVEAHRLSAPDDGELRAMLRHCPQHGFDLLSGLRRHRDWTTMRPRAIGAAFDSLRRCYSQVIVDIEPDLEGELDTGSFDIADRNALSRRVSTTADLVIVTGRPDLVGLDRLVRAITDLLDHGIDGARIQPLVPHTGRQNLRARSVRSSLDALLDEIRPGADVPSVEAIDMPAALDAIQLDGSLFPATFLDPLRTIVTERLELLPAIGSDAATDEPPRRVQPGTLGIAS